MANEELARADFEKAAGKVVEVREGHIGIGDDIDLRQLARPVRVRIADRMGENDLQFNREGRGICIDTYYGATLVESCPMLEALGIRLCWLDGPVYHGDGRVEYPEWWPQLQAQGDNQE